MGMGWQRKDATGIGLPADAIRADVLASVQARIKSQDVPSRIGERMGTILAAIIVVVGIVGALVVFSRMMPPLVLALVVVCVVVPILPLAAVVLTEFIGTRRGRIYACLGGARLGPQEALALEQWIKTTAWQYLDRKELIDALWATRDLQANPRIAEALRRAGADRGGVQRS
jgi:hypothetical protein